MVNAYSFLRDLFWPKRIDGFLGFSDNHLKGCDLSRCGIMYCIQLSNFMPTVQIREIVPRSGPSWIHQSTVVSKGQYISEWIYEVIVSPKIWTQNCQDSCPSALCSEAHKRAQILTIFCSDFERNNDFRNWFRNLLNFSTKCFLGYSKK